MLPFCLVAGVSINDFWFLTLREMKQVLKSHKESLKQRASFSYAEAKLITAGVSTLIDSKNKMPSLETAFPNLFDEVPVLREDWRVTKQRLLKFAEAHNKQVAARGKADG